MRTRRFRLTKAAKALIFILVTVLIVGGAFTALKTGFVKWNSDKKDVKTTATVKKKKIDTKDSTINLSLDEWIGWKSVIDANGGLTTKKGSIYDKLGIKVNIKVMNDATQSSNALIKGHLNAAGYTVNRTAFLSSKFKAAGLDVVMPYITNYSNGGDGIIATDKFKNVESLVNAKIGVPKFSEAHSLVVWFVNQSDLPSSDKKKIIDNLIFFDTPDEVAKAFFAGKLDVAATWQPYLSQAQTTSNCHVLFSTANSSKLIMDGIVFRDDFAKSNKETVTKFIEGALQAADKYDTDFDAIKDTMPMFSGMSDSEIKETTKDATLTSWSTNKKTLEEEAPITFDNMCDVWKSVGESVDRNIVKTLFDTSYADSLEDKYKTESTETSINKVEVTNENKEEVIDTEALLTKSATVNFMINTAKFTDTAEASKTLDSFIKVAKVLDGTIIQIEGNTDPNPNSDPKDKANKMLSTQRAETVKKYFVMNGISADRIITIGNGSKKPVVKNDTEKHRAMNRRTDVSFKCIE